MQDTDVAGQWGEAARYWEKHRAVIERMFAPVAAALVQEASVAPGQAVLDVATGPGEPALSVARIVGALGTVVGVDVVPAMIEAARREAEGTAASVGRQLPDLTDHRSGADVGPLFRHGHDELGG